MKHPKASERKRYVYNLLNTLVDDLIPERKIKCIYETKMLILKIISLGSHLLNGAGKITIDVGAAKDDESHYELMSWNFF